MENAVKQRQNEDFNKNIEANKAWADLKASELDPRTFLIKCLKELYEILLNTREHFSVEKINKLKSHFQWHLDAKVIMAKNKTIERFLTTNAIAHLTPSKDAPNQTLHHGHL